MIIKMFTGIITALGRVLGREAERLSVAAHSIVDELRPGESVAINGVCLTVIFVDRDQGRFAFELSPETLERTTLSALQAGDLVNIELPLRVGDCLGGHLVQGHVDTVGEVLSIEPQGEFRLFTFKVDSRYDALLVEKGAVAIDGISLTPFHIAEGRFEVAVVPQTLRATNLQQLRPGARVNVEFDLIAKYVAKQLREEV